MIMRRFLIGLALCALAACSIQTQSAPTQSEIGNINLTATALWNDAVFDRDTRDVVRAMASATDASVANTVFAIDGKGGKLIDFDIMTQHYATLRPADLYVSFITTHGLPEGLVAGSDQDYALVPAAALNRAFEPIDDRPHLIILQACYSGALIPELSQPNRIILTAASATRTSFGCSNDNTNTWYTKALKSALQAGKPLKDIYATTRDKVLAFESAQGVPRAKQSNPKAYVGQNMKAIWGRPL